MRLHFYLRFSDEFWIFPKRRAVAIHYGLSRKSVALEWQKDLLRFLPKGQGDIKEEKKESCQM